MQPAEAYGSELPGAPAPPERPPTLRQASLQGKKPEWSYAKHKQEHSSYLKTKDDKANDPRLARGSRAANSASSCGPASVNQAIPDGSRSPTQTPRRSKCNPVGNPPGKAKPLAKLCDTTRDSVAAPAPFPGGMSVSGAVD